MRHDVAAQRPLRVVCLGHSAQLSGAELALLRLLPHVPGVTAHNILAEHGPLVGAMREAGLSAEVMPLAERTAKLSRQRVSRRLPVRAALDTALYTLRLARRLRQLRPDVVHTNTNKAHLYGGVAARLARVPQLWHVRDRVAPEFMPAPAVAAVRRVVRLLPRAVVANSRSTIATVPGAPLAAEGGGLLRDPVLWDEFTPREPVGSGPLLVGMLGRLTPWKGQDLFLDAFAEAFADRPDVRARIVGSALFGEEAYAEELRARAERLGIADRVDFAGFRRDVPAALAELDVLVHASVIPEPFGQVVVEGMAAGLPVVASGEGGPAEVIEDGVDGVLFEPRDPASLASALRRVGQDDALRRRLGAAARETSRDYAPQALGEQLAATYRSVAR